MSHQPSVWVGRFPGVDGVVTVNVDTAPATNCTLDIPGDLRFAQALEPVLPLSPEKFRPRLGRYSDGDITVVLAMLPDDGLTEPFAFYADLDHDALVRLYRVADDRMVSEQGEELIFDADGNLVLTVDDCAATLSRSDAHVEEEVSFLVSGTPTVLAGTLLRPAGSAAVPGVVMAHASGWHHRDGYRAFAHRLVDAGVAVLIYDRQGYGSSTGDPDTSLRANAAGLEAAIDFLAERDDIGSVGLWGLSNGMWTVPLVAARRPDVAFVAGIGAPGVSMRDAELHRRTNALTQAGLSESAVALAGKAWRALFDAMSSGNATAKQAEALEKVLVKLRADESVRSYSPPEYARSSPELSPLPPLSPGKESLARFAKDADPQFDYDPAGSYRVIGCPVLLQYGNSDANVPAGTSAERIREALDEGGNPEVTITGYDDAGHLLETAGGPVRGMTAEEAEYRLHRFRFAPGAVSELTEWFRNLSTPDSD